MGMKGHIPHTLTVLLHPAAAAAILSPLPIPISPITRLLTWPIRQIISPRDSAPWSHILVPGLDVREGIFELHELVSSPTSSLLLLDVSAHVSSTA